MAKEKVQEPQTWFNVQEASDYLRISRPSLYELIKKGALPSYTIKGLKGRRCRREDLDALMIPDESFDFVVIHINVPHDPPIYNSGKSRLTPWGFGLGYSDNLLLSDKLLTEIRTQMEANELWDASTVVVSSDHGWRQARGAGSEPGAIPLIVKLAHSETAVRIDEEISSLVTHDLLMHLLEHQCSSEELAAWLRARSSD